MMTRILVRPTDLQQFSAGLRQTAFGLRAQGSRLNGAMASLEWDVGERALVEQQVADARVRAALLAGLAEQMAEFLASRADLFLTADARGLEVGLMPEAPASVGLRGDMGPLVRMGGAVAAGVPLMGSPGFLPRQFPELFGTDFLAVVGVCPVADGQFSGAFADWAAGFNQRVAGVWAGKSTDHAGTAAGDLAAAYQLTPHKVEQLWAVAAEQHVDPRLLLAILQQEGTGSFNTNPANEAFYGGHGPNPDWNQDLRGALEGPVLAKLRLYPKAVEGGFTGTWVDWVNWYTPIDTASFEGAPGVYAADIRWGDGVAGHLQELSAVLGSGDADPVRTYSDWMGAHPELYAARHIDGDFVIKPGLAPGAHRPELALWGGPPRPDYPGTTGPRDGFWWFPAPDEFCWHMERR